MNVAEALAAAKKSGDFASLVDVIPYLRFLGVRAEVRERGAAMKGASGGRSSLGWAARVDQYRLMPRLA